MTRRRPSRLLVVGWDAADADTVGGLLAEGRLPTLASLLDTGTRSEITGWSGLGDDAVWTTFSTGVHPGEHGVFHYVQPAPGGFHPVRTEHRVEPFWARLADEGLTVSVLDVPKSPPGRRAGTRELHDWMPHGPNAPEPTVWPAHESIDRRPHGEFAECNQQGAARLVADFHLGAIDDRRRHRTEVLLDWLGDGPGGRPSDVTICVYAAPHCAGHNFWYLHQPRTDVDRADRERLGDPLVEQLQAMDADLARAIERLGAGGAVAVFSVSGMQPTISAEEATDRVVVELDRVWRRRHLRARVQTLAVRVARRLRGRRRRHRTEHAFAPIDYLAGAASAVRLNVIGRDRWGVIRPGDRRAVLEWLRDELSAAVDAEGRPVYADVYLTDDRFPGPRSDAHSDLIVVWGLDQPASIRTPSVALDGLASPEARPGDHRPDGWLVSSEALAAPPDEVRIDELAAVITGWAHDLRNRPPSVASG